MITIENAKSSNHLCSLHVTSEGAAGYRGFLAIRRADNPLEGPPRYGWKLEVPGTFGTHGELVKAGNTLFARYLKGEVSASVALEKERFRGYRITGTARFQVVDLKWEPVLELKKVEEPNKGQKQIVMGHDTAFSRNLFSSSEGAAKFAFDFGKNMVLGGVQGLEI